MPRATEIVPAGAWTEAAADVVRLDYDRRTRRRIALEGRGGLAFLLDLAKAPVLRAGDGIRLEDGRVVAVEAAPEALLEITCSDAALLARVAWHLGNRHLATEIGETAIHIRDDHVIADMVHGLGARARLVQRAFNPEGGAYGHGAVQGHSHSHSHAHGHSAHHHPHTDGDHNH